MDRRNFLKSVAALAVAAKLLPARKPIPDWRTDFDIVNSKPSPEQAAMMDGWYSYRYVYRNSVTGCSSDASPVIPPQHTFMMPEHDVIDVYRLQENGEFEWMATL